MILEVLQMMPEIDDSKIMIKNDKDETVECDVLFTFESEETHKSYIVYTDNTVNKEGMTNVYASIYKPGKGENESILEPIENEKELAVVDKILEELQESIKKDDFMNKDRNNHEMETLDSSKMEELQQNEEWISNLPIVNGKKSTEELAFDNIVKLIKEEKDLQDSTDKEKISETITTVLMREKNEEHVNTLFSILNEIGINESSYFSMLGMSAYELKNYLVAEKAYRTAVNNVEDGSMMVTRYKNNLAYLIRRKEIGDPNKRVVKEIPILLRDGVKQKDTFSLINMALFWALERGKEDDWELADKLFGYINQNDIKDALQWWQEVADSGEVEGFLVHLFMLRHGKVAGSPFGNMDELFKCVKKEYPGILEKMKTVVHPF